MLYVVGYPSNDGFVVLYESDNKHMAILVYKQYKDRSREIVKIKKRGLTGIPLYDIM